MSLTIQQIMPDDVALMEALLATFGEAFDALETPIAGIVLVQTT